MVAGVAIPAVNSGSTGQDNRSGVPLLADLDDQNGPDNSPRSSVSRRGPEKSMATSWPNSPTYSPTSAPNAPPYGRLFQVKDLRSYGREERVQLGQPRS